MWSVSAHVRGRGLLSERPPTMGRSSVPSYTQNFDNSFDISSWRRSGCDVSSTFCPQSKTAPFRTGSDTFAPKSRQDGKVLMNIARVEAALGVRESKEQQPSQSFRWQNFWSRLDGISAQLSIPALVLRLPMVAHFFDVTILTQSEGPEWAVKWATGANFYRHSSANLQSEVDFEKAGALSHQAAESWTMSLGVSVSRVGARFIRSTRPGAHRPIAQFRPRSCKSGR